MSNLLRLKEASIKAGTAELPAFKKSNDDLQRGIDSFQNARCVPAESIYPPTHALGVTKIAADFRACLLCNHYEDSHRSRRQFPRGTHS